MRLSGWRTENEKKIKPNYIPSKFYVLAELIQNLNLLISFLSHQNDTLLQGEWHHVVLIYTVKKNTRRIL